MRRRELLAGLACGLYAWPVLLLAQRAPIAFIGFLNSGSPNERAHLVEGFRRGLKEGGLVDGQDVAIEYRWAEGRFDRLPALALDLVNRKVAVIAASGGLGPGVAAKAATVSIPIVFTGAGDPVRQGLVASLARPGGNATGIVNLASSLEAKRFEILRDLLPSAARIAYLVNPKYVDARLLVDEIQAAADAGAAKITIFNASSESEIDAAFAAIRKSGANAVVVATDAFFLTRRDQVVALAAQYAIPASYSWREFPVAGGLMSYGSDLRDIYRQVGVYTARIVKGAKPADLPVIQSAKFELVVNSKTARALGIAIPREFLARVDEVVE